MTEPIRRRSFEEVHVGPLPVCETCEAEVDVLDAHTERVVCRQCGVAFLLDLGNADETRRVG